MLARLYPTESDARRVAHDANVPPECIDWNGSAQNCWHALLDEASKRGLLDAVISIAREEYPNDTAVRGCDALGALYSRRDELRSEGRPTNDVDDEIRRIRRAQRQGPQLHPNEYLGGDRYRLIEEIGHGGFATVWRAFDRHGKRHVAVKVLHGQFVRDEERIQRFDRGARALQSLQHRNVVRIEQLRQVENGFHYFVMEYVPGGTLRDAVLERRISTRDALEVVAAVGEALSHAHEAGVIHRDVKPANILLRADGQGVLTDFDLALLGDSTGGTRTGAMGTYLYIAPEVSVDARNADARSDVFSLGVTALFVLLGREPTLKERVNHEAALSKLACDEALKSAVAQAMADEVPERFQSIAAFVVALRGARTTDAPIVEAPRHLSPTPPSPMPPREPGQAAVDPPRPDPVEYSPRPDPEATPPEAVRRRPMWDWFGGVVGIGISVVFVLLVVLALVAHPHTPQPDVPNAAPPCPSDMVLIPAGEFLMGSSDGQGESDEHPQHRVRFAQPFCMERTEVSVASYRACVAAGACEPAPVTVDWPGISAADRRYSRFCNGEQADRLDHPMNCVNWSQSKRYCEWSGHESGARRLPREAEWEYAARGSANRTYPWGEAAPDGTRTNLCGDECRRLLRSTMGGDFTVISGWHDDYGATAPVTAFSAGATPEGLLNMAGNVWEWVDDVYASDAYLHHDAEGFYARDASVPSQSTESRVVRGGGWVYFDASVARAANRSGNEPSDRSGVLGFRCARGVR